MGNPSVVRIEAVIDYIENHLDGKLELETVAEAVHYSKYHLHRLFTDTVGMTIHDYVQRRQLTEAAKLLVFSDQPIIEIALICGYESQQSFSLAFKAMYKSPPAEYRENRCFYPLQLRFTLHRNMSAAEFTMQDIRLARREDVPDWMNLMRLVIDGYPVMDEADYSAKLEESIDEKRALVLKAGNVLIGAMAFTYSPGSIEFLGVHPQYRNRGIQRLFSRRVAGNISSRTGNKHNNLSRAGQGRYRASGSVTAARLCRKRIADRIWLPNAALCALSPKTGGWVKWMKRSAQAGRKESFFS